MMTRIDADDADHYKFRAFNTFHVMSLPRRSLATSLMTRMTIKSSPDHFADDADDNR